MTTQINLTQLRADIEADEGYGDSWHLSPWLALALIDTAEAAIAVMDEIEEDLPQKCLICANHETEHVDGCPVPRLRETLNRYTTNP